jgi:pilus assembly protein CpaF
MFSVIIAEKGGEKKKLSFDKAEVTIGRVQGNDVILPKGNVSKRHSRILLKDGKFIIVDLRSTNGTYVNGRKITSPLVLQPSDKVYIGDFIMQVEPEGGAQPAAPPKGPPPRRRGAPPPPPRRGAAGGQPQPRGGPPPAPAGEEKPPPAPPQKSAPPEPSSRRRSRGGPPPRRPAPQPAAADAGGAAQADAAEPPPRRRSRGPEKRGAPPPRRKHPSQPPRPARKPPAPEPEPEPAPQQAAPPPEPEPAPQQAAPPPEPEPEPQAEPEPAVDEQDVATPVPTGKRQPSRRAERQQFGADDPRRVKLTEIQKKVHDRLIEAMDLRRLDMEKLADEELWDKTESKIVEIVGDMDSNNEIPSFVDRDVLVEDVLNEALGLGPLEEYLEDDEITEIMVNHAEQIYVEQNGRLTLCDKTFSSDKAVLGVIERIVAPIGRRIDESSPLVDARLRDGSRVNAIIPPLALKGPSLTIRKFKREMLGPDELVNFGTLTTGMVNFLKMCVEARKNIIISGGTGSGKTTTLNIVSNFIPPGERIITVEDAAELQIHHDHWVQLESRPPNIEGKGAIHIRDLVRNCLRMRPDRIIVGECRGGESLDMLQAMNTGHDGSLTTAHSNNPRDTLSRLETMVLMSGMELPIKAIREQIAAAIDIVVHQSRFPDGTRKVTHITEVTGMEGEVITLQDIFNFKQEGFDAENNVKGRFVASGFIPRFYEDLQRRGIEVDMSIFREE